MWINALYNRRIFLVLNLIVIFLVEITGRFFADTGLIHFLAIIFVGLALIRALIHPHVHDQYLEPILHRGIFAMFIFAVSHVVEFAGFMIFHLPRAVISVNVVNFYLASILIVITGVEIFIGKLNKFSQNLTRILEIFIFVFIVIIFFVLSNQGKIDLSSSSILTIIYTLSVMVVVIFGLWRLSLLKRQVPIMSNFLFYYTAAFILIGLSAFSYTLEEIITNSGFSFLQLIYVGHFLFYGALSLIFLAYDQLLNLGGLYNDLEKMELSK